MWYEFQAKGTNYPVFKLKTPNYEETNLLGLGPDKKVISFNDGQRLIGKVIEEKFINGSYYWEVEDTEGNTTSLCSKEFHKITNPKNFSKKFILFKTKNHILD